MEEKIIQSQNLMLQVILANTSSAMKISKTLSEHSDDKIMKADNIICGLIYRLMTPMTDEEIEESMHSAEDILFNDSSSSDEDNDNELVDDIKDFEISRKVKTNNCNCNICSHTRVCLLNFNEYIPKDELADKYKNSIIETCHKYNKII